MLIFSMIATIGLIHFMLPACIWATDITITHINTNSSTIHTGSHNLTFGLAEVLECGEPMYAHVGQHAYCSQYHLNEPLKKEPQAGPWLIREKHEPNQSVINFLYGISLDDNMSGNTQG